MIEPDKKTIWCGNLPEQITEELLYELFLQAGPLQSVRIARDKMGRPKNFAFITYNHEVSVPYALNLLRGTTLFNRTITMKSRGPVALLPPPIRCVGPDPSVDFSNLPSVAQQFATMAFELGNLRENNPINEPRHGNNQGNQGKEKDDRLVMASLQGNWTHRHHPYRAKEMHNRDNYRPREHDNYRNRDRPSGNWRDRRYNNKKSHYHRRE